MDITLMKRYSTLIFIREMQIKAAMSWDFPGGPVAENPHPQCRAPGLIPGQGTRSHLPLLKKKRSHMLQLRSGAAK